MKTAFLFQTWPYAAVLLFVSGMAARYLGMREPTSAKRHWAFDGRDLFSRTALLQINLFLLLLAHLAGLLFPQRILLWNGIPFRLYALEIYAFGAGLAALAGWALLAWRHLRQSDASIGRQAAEAVFLSLLFTTLLSGSLTAILFRWGSSWGVILSRHMCCRCFGDIPPSNSSPAYRFWFDFMFSQRSRHWRLYRLLA